MTLLGIQAAQNKPANSKGHHHPKGEHHEGMHYRKSGGKYQRIVEEELDPQRKSMNQQIRQIEEIIKKNMLVLAAERRRIKNLNSLDAKNKSKDAINAVCEEIKDGINKFQAQISNTIDEIEMIYSEE